MLHLLNCLIVKNLYFWTQAGPHIHVCMPVPKNHDGFVSDVRQGLQRDDRVVRDDRSHPDVVRDGGKLAAGRRWND
jgi:hypothetical protein